MARPGSDSEVVAHCYRHPDREALRAVHPLRPADLPGLHAPGLGRVPLPRRRGQRPAHRAGAAHGRRGAVLHDSPPYVTITIVALNVAGLPGHRPSSAAAA